MRKDRLSCGTVLLLFGCFAASFAVATDAVTDTQADAEIEVGECAALETAPDLGLAVGDDVTCIDIGGWDDIRTSQQPERFRGDLYRIKENATLLEAIMELQITNGAEVTLVFSFHRAASSNEVRPFRRFGQADIAITVTGTGVAELYSTGLLAHPLTLAGGYDHLIGVSWFSTAVSFGRDERPYPRTFLHGQILGLALQNIAPPLPDDFGPFAIFQTGAYSMELCFESVAGACCKWTPDPQDDNCILLLESECIDAGSYFHGERVGCTEVFCQLGVCCFPCGDCSSNYTPETCVLEGGEWAGVGAECPGDACPVITGACCDGAVCTEACIEECEAAGGEYLGHGTTCRPNFCAGACCVTEVGCVDLTQGLCELVGGFGAFRGLGTTCAALPTDPSVPECGGACCATLLGEPVCFEVQERSDCSVEPGLTDPVYIGDALICDSDPQEPTCPSLTPVACCMPDGSCVVGSEEFCADAMGFEVAGDTTCASVTCDAVCCTAGECRMTPTAHCTGEVISTDPGDSCLDDPCTVVTGACCFPNGSWEPDVTQEECEATQGRFEECEAPCSGDFCPAQLGACCRPNGKCSDLVTPEECQAQGGGESDYHAGAFCEAASCPALGACCDTVGSCFFLLPEDCSAVPGGGTYVGPGFICTDNTCPTGACCEENECVERTAAGCDAAADRDYRGDGTVCDDGTVICGNIPGACCTVAGGCELLVPQVCFDTGGVFQGIDTGCSLGICDRGACCHLDGTCESSVVASECTGPRDTFLVGTSCGACIARGACCTDETCKDGVTEQVCTDPEGLNGVYDGDGTVCVTGLCTVGACCLPDQNGTCDATLTRQECEGELVGGVYQGTWTACTPGLCTLGACCHLVGTCDDPVFASECTDLFDEFSARFECRDFTCPAGGACCTGVGSECVDNADAEMCELQGGTYSGDGTICVPDLCASGACCLPDAVCGDTMTRQACEAAEGLYLGEGSGCSAEIDCTRGSCCTTEGVCSDNTVPSMCGTPEDFRAGSCAQLPCVGRGACCLSDDSGGYCEDDSTRAECLSRGGTYDGNTTTCNRVDLCVSGACCFLDGSCAEKTRQRCERGGGLYIGPELTCADSPCVPPWIVSSVPPDCDVDARQPAEPNGSNADGTNTITMTFNRPLPEVLTPDDFSVFLTPGIGDTPVITDVYTIDTVVILVFDPPLPSSEWTCFVHNESTTQTCVGSLPADVSGNGMSTVDDVSLLIDHLNGVADPALQLWQCDMNRSEACTAADLLRAIDLLNGADQYEPGWMDATFLDNEPCPSTPPKSNYRRVLRNGR